MARFWGAVATIALLAVALIFTGNQAAGINVTDLETECRYDRQEESSISNPVGEDRLNFEGQFPINSTESLVSYTYKVSDGEIVLNVRATERDKPQSYVGTCLGMVNYNADTEEISPGRYTVRVQHDGETVNEKIIRFD